MGILTTKDFSIALGIPYGTIRSKISRKQLCCNRSGLIDTDNPKNYSYILDVNKGNFEVFEPYFIKKVSSKKNKVLNNAEKTEKLNFDKPSDAKGLVNIASSVESNIIKAKIAKELNTELTESEKRELAEQRKQSKKLLEYELRKKEAEVTLIERNAELRQMELEKKAGNTLPLDQIQNLMAINFKAIFKSIHSQTKNIATVIVQQLGGSKEDLNSILIELEQILDTTVQDSKKKSEVDINKLIEEYSEVRSRGERK